MRQTKRGNLGGRRSEEDSKVVPSPAVKEDNGKAELDETDLVADEHRRFRSEG